MTRRFSGRHMTAILIAFFGVVIAVNLTMATFATRTFGGVVVENSYVASQKYNDWLAAAEQQQKLAWTIEPALDEQRHISVGLSIDGASVSGFARHPLGREADVPLTFIMKGAEARTFNSLPPGRWNIHLFVRRGESEARLIETLQ